MAYDYEALERSDEFRKLVKAKRSWVVPATVFFLVWYIAFILLAGYAEDFMGSEFLWDGVTVGYVLALTQFLMVWVLAGWYLRKAARDFDPLEERVRALAEEGVLPGTGGDAGRGDGEGRFTHEGTPIAGTTPAGTRAAGGSTEARP